MTRGHVRADRWRTALLLLGVVLLIVAARLGGQHLGDFAEWIRNQGAWGAVGFIAGYALATVAAVPGSLSPLLPYNALNYALGLTSIRFRHYLIGAAGVLPWTLLYVYTGRLAGDLVLAGGDEGVPPTGSHRGVLVLGLFATLAATVWIGRIARRALADEIEPGEQ